MKKLFLLLALLLSNFLLLAQPTEPCTVKYYIQSGHSVANLLIDCDTVLNLHFSVYNSNNELVSKFTYPVEANEDTIQLSMIYFPEGEYFITVFDGREMTCFKLSNYHKNP